MFRYQTILILLFVLGAATCFISYLSDKMGMKLGKKRLSLKVGRFTLRPRQTATLLSMGSSLLVMFLTMAVLFATFPALRNALLRYDTTRRENTNLNRRNQELRVVSSQQKDAISQQTQANKKLADSLQKRNSQLTSLNASVGQKQQQVVAAQRSLDSARQNLAEATRARVEAQSARDAARNAQQQAQNGENRARQSESNARQNESQARSGEARARVGFVQAQARFVVAQQKEALARRGVQDANRQLTERQKQLSSTRNRLRDTQTRLKTAQTQTETAQQQAVIAQNRTLEAQRQATATFKEKAAAEAKLKVTNEQLAAAEIQIAAADTNLNIAKGLLSGEIKVAVTAGQIFSDATVSSKTEAAQALIVLRNVLSEAAQNAKQSGFQVVQLDKVSIQQNGQPVELSDEQNMSLTAAFLAANAPVSVRVVAARDHPEGETRLLVRVQGVTIRPAFASGELLAQTTIKGGQSGAAGDASVFNRLLALLDEGQKKATQRKVTPIATAAEPNLFASDTRLSIFEALRQIQQKSGDVPVRLVAARALSTVDPVSIRIEVGAPANAANAPTDSANATSSNA